jgi:DNA-binding NarL/FixJ family response regulator
MGPRLLIVDDHVGFRRIAAALCSASGFDVVDAVGTGRRALEVAEILRPDVVLLDVQLPDVLGFDLVAPLHAIGAVVILTSTRSVGDYGSRVSECEAGGFVAKDELTGPTLHAIVAGAVRKAGA